jgi:hypothetical protein
MCTFSYFPFFSTQKEHTVCAPLHFIFLYLIHAENFILLELNHHSKFLEVVLLGQKGSTSVALFNYAKIPLHNDFW